MKTSILKLKITVLETRKKHARPRGRANEWCSERALDPFATIERLEIWHEIRRQEIACTVRFDLGDHVLDRDADLLVLYACDE